MTASGRIHSNGSRAKRLAAGASALVLALAAGAAASAQTQADNAVGEVVVTASRVTAAGFTAPTPTTVIGADAVERKAATNVRDILYDLPQIAPSSVGGQGSANPGGQYVNLRGVGALRTLVLVDGRRVVPTNINGNVDISLIPAFLVERLEVVTGGASAAWGSDAVAGVVNIILKKKIDGLEGQVQYNVTQLGDNKGRSVNLAYGHTFLDGRLQFNIAGEASKLDGVLDQGSRDWGAQHWALVLNPTYTPTNGQYRLLPTNIATYSQMTAGGVINNTILKGTQFGPGGVPTQFTYGTNVAALYQMGGSGDYMGIYSNLVSPLSRNNLTASMDFNVNDHVRLHAQGSYAYSRTRYDIIYKYDQNALTIQRDNAYLPAAIKATMTANNINNFTMGRVNYELGPDWDVGTYKTIRYVLAADGDFGSKWKWSTYYQHGTNHYSDFLPNQRIEDNWTRAVDSVIDPRTGKAVCRSTLTDPNNGCVPANVFGPGSIDPSVINYVNATAQFYSVYDQDVVAADLHGELGRTWAGPISVATGAEYRSEVLTGNSDPISQAKRFRLGNTQPIHGSNSVKEAFGEFVAPLAHDMPFAKNLDLNAAVRFTDYRLSGSVTTWKIGATYDVNDELRFRATRSHDIRAPVLNELYQPSGAGSGVLIDRFTNQQPRVITVTTGNRDLVPEKANTLTYGVVYRPEWLSGFSASVDVYDIDIKDAIGTVGAQQIIDRCFAGATNLCPLITRVNGVITQVTSPQLNLSEVISRGQDIEISYQKNLERISSALSGRLTLRALGNHVTRRSTNDGTTITDLSGQIGNTWKWTFTASYSNGPLNLGADVRYVGPGTIDNTYGPTDIQVNHVDAQYYVGLSAGVTLLDKGGRRLELFGRINNLLDRPPPIIPGTAQEPADTDLSLYDPLGRNFAIGLRFKY